MKKDIKTGDCSVETKVMFIGDKPRRQRRLPLSNATWITAIVMAAIISLIACTVTSLLIKVTNINKQLEVANASLTRKIQAPVGIPLKDGGMMVIVRKDAFRKIAMKIAETDEKKNAPQLVSRNNGGSDHISVYSESSEHFAFLLTKEQAKRPFNLAQ